MEDYSYLEGKEIRVTGRDKSSFVGIIAGINIDIGITIVEKEFQDNNLVCINGPSTKYFKEKGIQIDAYRNVFYSVIEELKDGVYIGNGKRANMYFGRDEDTDLSNSNMAPCPYSGE